jgi:uncharacterized protein YfaS (alpha-2-macroglobulin family)
MSTAPIAPRPSRRFWFTVAAFAVANGLAWVLWAHHFAAAHRGVLRVASVDPGDNAAVATNAAVRWHFDADVIPTDVYKKPPGQSVPPVAGRWAWESPRTLAFLPAVGLPRATPVTFTLATDLIRTGTGAQLAQPCVVRLRPEPLVVKSVRQAAMTADGFVIEMRFNDRVAPGDVLAHLVAKGPDGKGVRCRLNGQAAGNVVLLRAGPFPIASDGTIGDLSLDLTPGLVGAAGPLGLDQPYHATIPLARALAATGVTPYSPTRERPFITVHFNGEVDSNDLRQVLSVDPPTPVTFYTFSEDVSVIGDFKPGKRYTITLADPPPGTPAADRARYPRATRLAAVMPDVGSDCWLDTDQGYLSTVGNRTLTAHVMNVDQLDVSITRVYDDNLVAWRNDAARERYSYRDPADLEPFARPAGEKHVDCRAPRNVAHDVRLSLDDLLPAELPRAGAWRVTVTSAKATDPQGNPTSTREASAIVTLSDVGLTAKRTRGGLFAWATSLRTAEPLAGVRVRAYTDKNQLVGTATTDGDGLAHLSELNPAPGETVAVLLADLASQLPGGPADLTWLDLRKTAWDLGDTDTSGKPYLRDGHVAFAYADRGVYRPGETVHLRAIVRGPGDVAPKQTFPVQWRFRRPDLHDWRIVPAMLDRDGATAADVPLPADLPTGQWTADVSLPGDAANPFGTVSFGVEEFVPNRLKVDLKLGGNDGRFQIDGTDSGNDRFTADVKADYLFGRPAAGLTVDLIARATPVPFAPAGWSGWTFGDAADIRTAPAARHVARKVKRILGPDAPDDACTVEGGLDEDGKFHDTFDAATVVHLDGDPSHANRYLGPWRVTTEAAVHEAGGRAVTVSRQIEVDALPDYIAVRRTSADQPVPGQPCPFEIKLVKPDGSKYECADTLQLRLLRETWNTTISYRDGQYQYDSTRVLTPVATKTVAHADYAVARWAPVPQDDGRYVLEVVDTVTGAVTTTGLFATDGQAWDDSVNRSHPDRLDVRVLGPGEPDAPGTDARVRPASPAQQVGSQARVLVSAPFAGRLLLTVETDQVLQSQVIDMPASHVVVPVDVTADCRPGAFITATVLRPVDPNAAWRPHRAFGVARLNVDPGDRKLAVAIDAPEELRPMRSLDVGLTVTDADGNAVPDAAVNVAAVDEGICSLTDFQTPDPLAFFSAPRALGVDSADLYGLLVPETARPDVGGDGAGELSARHHSPIGGHRVRPVALAWSSVHTDSAGHAVASFPVPAFQGRLRVMAVAYTPDRVGSADRGVTVRSPLLAQTSWPRFAAPGDRFIVPVVLFNNLPAGGTANVTVEPVGTDGLLSCDVAVPPVTLAAGGQQRFDVPVTVGKGVGVARVRLTATMNGESFVEETELPVRPAAPTMEFGGVVRGGTKQPTPLAGLVPMVPGTGSVRVDVTAWPQLNLPKGLDYLDRYPYGCSEQTTSTLFPLVALGEIGKRVDPARFEDRRIRDKVDAGVVQLLSMQTADGGLSMWPGETEDWPWASVYAAHFLTVARLSGYAVPDDFYNALIGYVRHQLEQEPSATGGVEVQAYAAYVLALAGQPERSAMNRMAELTEAPNRPTEEDGIDGAGGDARLFLSLAELLSGRRDVAEKLMPAGTPVPRKVRKHDGNLDSPTRDRALLILALEDVDPDRPDLPDLVQQLADTKWQSTQDVAFSVLAIGQYLRDQPEHQPKAYAAARLLLGQTVLAEATAGAPLTWTGAAGPMRVELSGASDAVGHVAWLQSGVPLAPPAAVSHGITVKRRYVMEDGGQEVVGSVRSGDLVRVELSIDGPPNLPNVVLEDLLPAGLEVENARLATAAKDVGEDKPDDAPPVFGGMTDVRDDRVIVVGRISGNGHGLATYLARAVTPGVYVAPPARAEAMYDLDTNGLSASGTLTVTGGAPANVAKAD